MLALIALALMSLSATAQSYSTLDTLSLYPNKGTYYHDRFEGRKTASGEVFDQNAFTAAHWKIKLGTHILVTNRNNGRQVIVKVNDRCPKRGVIDMTHRAAAAIGILGCQDVTVRLLPEGYEQQCLAQDAIFDSVRSRRYPHVNPPHRASTSAPASSSQQASSPTPSPSATLYNIYLGTAASHTEAYNHSLRLSAAHRERFRVDPLEGSDSLGMSLDVRLDHTAATRLLAKMRPHFPAARMETAE